MTETISAPDTHAAASPQLPRPRTDADALRAIEDATEHVRGTSLLDKTPAPLLAKVDAASAAG